MKTLHLSRQHGATLLTALIFLVILTLLGIGMYSTTTSEEKMARNFRDKEIALQAAEAALNEAKIWITASYDNSSTPTCSTSSTCPQPLTTDNCPSSMDGFICEPSGITDYKSYDLFASGAKSVTAGSNTKVPNPIPPGSVGSPAIADLAARPRYLVVLEKDSSMCGPSSATPYCFKILAQAQGRMGTTRVNIIEQFTN